MASSTGFESFARSELRFERLAVLAVSSMAEVELCRVLDAPLQGQLVAVTRLPEDLIDDEDRRNMFRDEIWMAAALAHPNVARVLSWGSDERGPYLVSEFVPGVALSRLMRTVFTTGEAFSERLVVYLASRVSMGLAAAHSLTGPDGEFLNLVHRDLTPANILVGFDGAVKITDFGLAKAKQRVTHTQVGFTKGTPAYMSPEQVLGKQLDGRSDVFALGMVMYELFAHQLPFEVRTVKDALLKIVKGPDPDLATHAGRIDKALVTLVNRCLRKGRDDRYENVQLLRADLDKWLELHGYDDTEEHLARFVRRNAMRQMRWLDRAMRGDLKAEASATTLDAPEEVSERRRAPTSATQRSEATSVELPQPPAAPSVAPPLGPSEAPTTRTRAKGAPSARPAATAVGLQPPERAPPPRTPSSSSGVLPAPSSSPSSKPGVSHSEASGGLAPPRPRRPASERSGKKLPLPSESLATAPPTEETEAAPTKARRRRRADTATVVAHRSRDAQRPLGGDDAVSRDIHTTAAREPNPRESERLAAAPMTLDPDVRRGLDALWAYASEASRRSRAAAEEAAGAARVAEAAARRARDEGERADAMQRAVQGAVHALELQRQGDSDGARRALADA
ncbi:MAG: serine/threonine-protein kinase, partial [Myxococcota bacterium]